MHFGETERPLRLSLEATEVISCRDRAAFTIACESGLVWRSAGEGDVVLRAGEQAVVPRASHAVLQAIEPAVLLVGRNCVREERGFPVSWLGGAALWAFAPDSEGSHRRA